MIRSTFARRLLAGVLLFGLSAGPALASGQAVTLYDQRDNALGTATNPLVTTGGGGGSGGGTVTQGPPNAGGAAAWYVQWSGQSVAVSSMPAVVQGAAGSAPWLVSWSGQSVAVSALPSIPAGSNVIGAVTQSGGPWTISGTVAATQSGSWTVSLGAGSAAIGSVAVSNFPASQPVTNAGTFAVQNTAAVVGGNATAVKVDGSAVTQPVSGAVTANLGTLNGAATAAGQSNTAAGTSATTAQGVQGVTGGVALPISAAALPLPTGSATAANQTATQNNPGTSGTKADAVQGVTGGVPVPIQAAIWYSEGVNSAVSAGNTYFGTTRTNTAAGTASSWGYWTVQIQTSAAGTLTIRNSVFDQTFSVSAGQVMTQRVPALGPSFATLFAPTSGAATITVFDSYSAN